jgi:hypothetical protein
MHHEASDKSFLTSVHHPTDLTTASPEKEISVRWYISTENAYRYKLQLTWSISVVTMSRRPDFDANSNCPQYTL